MYSNLQTIAAIAATGLLLPACQTSLDRIGEYEGDPGAAATDIRLAEAPEGFDFATTAERELAVNAVGLFGDGPLADVAVRVFVEGAGDSLALLAEGRTDAAGTWRPELTLATDIDSVTLRVGYPGYPERHRVAVALAGVTAYDLGGENANGRVVTEPGDGGGEADGTADATGSGKLANRGSGLQYLGAYDRYGTPEYLTTESALMADALDFIAANFPASGSLVDFRPSYLNAGLNASLVFRDAGELWVSFAHEGTPKRNTFGYFTYDLDAPPTQVDDIPTRNIIFPNMSYRHSGGSLATGDRVYLGAVPANTGVCFFVIPKGWKWKSQVVQEPTDPAYTRYTIDALNAFAAEGQRRHSVLLANKYREYLALGFEDLNRPEGDEDFTDAILLLEPRPWSAIDLSGTPTDVTYTGADADSDNVPDGFDSYPTDPQRAFDAYTPAQYNYGTVAYEDMWPKTGDYDFNDLVVDYNVQEVLTGDARVKSLRIRLRVRALGATQKHGFAFQFPIAPSNVESVTGQVIGTNAVVALDANGTEAGVPTTVIPAFTDAFELLGTRQGLINTDPTLDAQSPHYQELVVTFATPVARGDLGVAPYDAFVIRGGNRDLEIHLAGFAPTAKADMTAFGTEADDSDPAAGSWYVDENNLPWALHLPAEFAYPKEKARLDEMYPDFLDWAVNGGTVSDGWWRSDNENIDPDKGY